MKVVDLSEIMVDCTECDQSVPISQTFRCTICGRTLCRSHKSDNPDVKMCKRCDDTDMSKKG